MADADDAIDRLYQLPLDEFTAARNALARERKDASIKSLEKPNIAAWAVNQLYWRERPAYDGLIAAAAALRAEHRKLLGGKAADIRRAEQAHRDAIRNGVDRVRGILEASGQAATPATVTAVQETLEALPSEHRPGRLTRPLKPRGFEALAGFAVAPQLKVVPPRPAPSRAEEPETRPDPKAAARARAEAKRRAHEERQRKERQREAEKALEAAEAAMLRAEEAVRQAERTLADLRMKRDEAVGEYQRARLRARESGTA